MHFSRQVIGDCYATHTPVITIPRSLCSAELYLDGFQLLVQLDTEQMVGKERTGRRYIRATSFNLSFLVTLPTRYT